MSAYAEDGWRHANITADLAGVRPLGDLVLVRMLPEAEMHRNLIWIPQFSGAHADRQLRPVLPSIGEVVAAGPGDKLLAMECSDCCRPANRLATANNFKCEECGGDLSFEHPLHPMEDIYRAPMHVSPGDRIMYWKRPSNEQVINDETFQLIHEEQDILGVIEDG